MAVNLNPNRAVASRPQPAKPAAPTVTPEVATRRPMHHSSITPATPAKRDRAEDVSDPNSPQYDPQDPDYDPSLDDSL